METNLRLTFNTNALNYDRYRPAYAEALFDDVIRFSELGPGKEALEIGIGTGQATLPFLQTGCRLAAVEIGDRLARFSADKFAAFDNFRVINQDFEGVQLEESTYDLVYSASAFHWIPQEEGIPKVRRLLRGGGVFAWFSIHPFPAPEHTHIGDALQEVYGRYSPFFGERRPPRAPQARRQQIEEMRSVRSAAFRKYGFVDVNDRLYFGRRTFDAGGYVALLGTYSDHIAMPEESRTPFMKEIAETIDRCGGEFTLCDTTLLCMGKTASTGE